jgi:hypothetical protein
MFPLFKVYQRIMISLTLRLDVLLVSWYIAAYIGREYYGKMLSPSSSQRRPPRRPTKRVSKPTTTTTVVKDEQPIAPSSSYPSALPDDALSDTSAADDGEELLDYDLEGDDEHHHHHHMDEDRLSSPLPQFPNNNGESSWSVPPDNRIFRVRGNTYLDDRIKIPSGPSPFVCRGVDVWLTDNPERHIARHPHVLGGTLAEEDTFLVNFLLPFGNFVSYFRIPPLEDFPNPQVAEVWTKFLQGDQQYRDARLKLLPLVVDGPWIVKAAVGNGTAPALLGKVIPLQYFFRESSPDGKKKGVYEVDVIITASSIAKGILSVVKGHTKALTIAFAFIIEAAKVEELPETVLCSFQVHALHLEDCPHLPECNLDDILA